jgi:hypothetical protein
MFLQKLKCPKCKRILGGKATTKKNGNSYYYYYCHECKLTIKEKVVEDFINQFIDEIIQYDSVVNQFFLPMIKQKFDNPKEEITKELKLNNDKLRRIKEAYINKVFSLTEYDEERKKLEINISELQDKLNESQICEELRFTPEDILIKRDIDFINRVKYPEKYREYNKSWQDYSRDEKANLIMNYIEEIALTEGFNGKCEVDHIEFRESIAKPCNELYQSGYLDKNEFAIFGNVVGSLRISEYIPEKKLTEHIMRLRQFYDVGYYEAIYNTEKQIFHFNFSESNEVLVRVFPLEDYRKIDPKIEFKEYNFGVLYIKANDEMYKIDSDNAFKYIPAECDSVVFSKEPVPIDVKPVLFKEEEISVI